MTIYTCFSKAHVQVILESTMYLY